MYKTDLERWSIIDIEILNLNITLSKENIYNFRLQFNILYYIILIIWFWIYIIYYLIPI